MSLSKANFVFSEQHRRSLSKSLSGRKPSVYAIKQVVKKNSREYSGLVSPDGKVYPKIFNLSQFCRDHNLGIANLHKVLCGKRKSHKGWTATEVCHY